MGPYKKEIVSSALIPLLLFSTTALGRSSALLVGGGCYDRLRWEMARESTNFASQMSALGWDFTSTYGDSKNRADLNDSTGSTFTREHFIEKLMAQTQKLKKGDQFLLNIVTHGGYEEQGHRICLGNGTTLDLNDIDIQEQLVLMQKKGVKIGIMDNSCYGGQTVELFSRYGCVISTQVGDFPSLVSLLSRSDKPTFGVSTIMRNLLKNSPENPVTLEDVFIDTALKYDEIGVFPQMSGLKRFGDSAIQSAFMINKEEDNLQDYRGTGCITGNGTELETLLQDLEKPLWSGYTDHRSRKYTYHSKESRKNAIRSLADQLQNRQASIKKKRDEQAQIEARVDELSKQFLKDLEKDQPIVLKEPTGHPFSSGLTAALSGRCKLINQNLACHLPLVGADPHAILTLGSAAIEHFHASIDTKILADNASQDVQLEWLRIGTGTANAAVTKMIKSHEDHSAIAEIEKQKIHYQVLSNDLHIEEIGVMFKARELSQALNVSRGLSYQASRSLFDNRKIKRCRSFVLNPKRK